MLTKSIEFKGLYPALMVGFNADNTLDLEGLKENVKYLMAQGCAGMCALTTFKGDGGPSVGNLFSRILYAIRFGSDQILLLQIGRAHV